MARKKITDIDEEPKRSSRFGFSLVDDKYGGGVSTSKNRPRKKLEGTVVVIKGPKPSTQYSRQVTFPNIEIVHSRKEADMTDEALKQAKLIAERYGVSVGLVRSNEEFYSDMLIKESVENHKYYVSEENPETSAQVTDWLIRYQAEKDRHLAHKAQERKLELLDIANEKRSEKSVQTAQDVAPKIAEITKQYCDAHNGKEPSLHKLADLLNDAKIPAPGGPQSKWYAQTVKRIINAEKSVHQK